MKLSICFTVDSVSFTKSVIDGTTSLGGSESACLGLARALSGRGHAVHIFTTQLGEDAPTIDHAGVAWHQMATLPKLSVFYDWDVVVALRQPQFLQHVPSAKFRVLWSQDLMSNEAMKNYVMALAWAYDAVAYVSDYHRHQWEGVAHELASIGWVTKNGHDAALATQARKSAVKKPHQVIHISRPERGLAPLLQMWPAIRKANPDATLALCRYSSMYDPQGWGEVCKSFDQLVSDMNAEVGGIEWLGELGKPALYQAIAESAVMWYPGVHDFAETSCIAAIEAQACGTPFVGSYKGALPETVPAAVLVPGDAQSAEYQAQSVAAVLQALEGCRTQSFTYRQQVKAGLAHVEGYSYEAVAEEWEQWLLQSFRARYDAQTLGVLHRLNHEDDLVLARRVIADLGTTATDITGPLLEEIGRAERGEEQSAEQYAFHAIPTSAEVTSNGARHATVVQALAGCRHVFDAACGNGAFAIRLALADPDRHVTAVDYAQANIDAATAAAVEFGVADRITFICAPVWDMDTQQPSAFLEAQPAAQFDGLFCGEFIEHVANCTGLATALERLVKPMGRLVWTCPFGPLSLLVPREDAIHRGHVHHFRPADLEALFGQKDAYTRLALPWQMPTGRGEAVGQWIVTYRHDGPVGERPMDRRILIRPYTRITAGIITNNTLDLRRCLDSVWSAVDEIILGDCGTRQGELAQIAAEFPRKTRIIPVGVVPDLPAGFSEARNTVLKAATGDWFFWIDSDEILCGAMALGKYADGAVFNGYAIAQNHLYLDASMSTDTPVRLFRTRPDIQFYGCIHEQPQMGDCNGDVVPALQVGDVQIAHTGYLHEGIRRDKAINRNLPLLVRDQQVFPDRVLGKMLVLRDHANLAYWGKEQNRGQLTEAGRYHYGQVVALFEAYFADPSHRYHSTAKPFYEAALRHVNGALEVEVGIAGAPNGLGDEHARAERVWARTPEQMRALLHARIDAMIDPLVTGPALMDVEPLRAEVPV